MIILKHNFLSSEDLFSIETIMLKIAESPYEHTLEYSLLNKPRAEVYGFIAGLFKRMEICETLGITTSDFLDFLIDIEKGYRDNPYHSFYHAVDVTMVLYHMMTKYETNEYLTKVDLAMVMIAALCHDIGHPGKNNHFEVACHTKVATQYNNISVLESQSSSIALKLLEKHRLLRHIGSVTGGFGVPTTEDEFKSAVVKMILATDMACHFTLKENISILHDTIHHKHPNKRLRAAYHRVVPVQKQKKALKMLFPVENDSDPFAYFEKHYFKKTVKKTATTATSDQVLNSNERLMLCKILIHASDISNPCRPWPVFYQLSKLVCIEFFRQGEEERRLGLPISPNMNRHEAKPSSINVGFIDYIVQPYFEALSALFPKCQQLAARCKQNRAEWIKIPTEEIDILGNRLLPIEVALSGGGSTQQQHVTIAAGAIQIPESLGEKIRKKLKSTTTRESSKLLSPSLDQETHLRLRRKSEEVSILHQLNRRSRASISKQGRRNSDGFANLRINQPKMVPFFDCD